MSAFWLIGAVVFFLGLAIGSFLNALVYRTTKGQDWVKDRSRCEHCKRIIPWYENIPVISFVFLRGRCAKCGRPIDITHPIIELLTGSMFVWWYVVGWWFFKLSSAPMQHIQPIFWLFAGSLLIAILISDLKYLLIPRWAVLLLTGTTLLYRLALILAGEMQLVDFGRTLIWTVLLVGFFFSLWLVTKGKGFGFGDVQLAVPLSLILGSYQRILVAVLAAFVSGALVGLGLVIFGKKGWKQAVPFGPFLILGTTLSLVWGLPLFEWYVRIVLG